jgi:hypothetical protein
MERKDHEIVGMQKTGKHGSDGDQNRPASITRWVDPNKRGKRKKERKKKQHHTDAKTKAVCYTCILMYLHSGIYIGWGKAGGGEQKRFLKNGVFILWKWQGICLGVIFGFVQMWRHSLSKCSGSE